MTCCVRDHEAGPPQSCVRPCGSALRLRLDSIIGLRPCANQLMRHSRLTSLFKSWSVQDPRRSRSTLRPHTHTHTPCLRLTKLSCRTSRSNRGRVSVNVGHMEEKTFRDFDTIWPSFSSFSAATRKQEVAGIRSKFPNKIPVSVRHKARRAVLCRCRCVLTCCPAPHRWSSSATSGRSICPRWTKPSSWSRTNSPWPSLSPSSGTSLCLWF